MQKAIIIFVRNPEIGKVKTRLAKTLGDQAALDIYKILLQHTFDVSKAIKADKFVFYHDAITEHDLWPADGFYKKLQQGNDLGEKMKHAFTEVFSLGYKQVIIIGSDCLQLTIEIANDALDALQDHDSIIGPAKDGGYYLLGLKTVISNVFENKNWSTATVFENTLADLQNANLTTAVLPMLTDVDTEADWLESKTR